MSAPSVAPYDPAKDREVMRGALARRLVWILAGTLVAMGVLAGGGWVTLDATIPVLSTLVGVVGGAVGFYFGGDTHYHR